MNSHTYISSSPEETWAIAGRLVASLPSRATVALCGELGSGKTCFVQGMARALGIRRAVTSPTFTVVNEYRGNCHLTHIDLYRLHGPDEVLALGFDEYLEGDGITAIEWPDRAEDLLPEDAVFVCMETRPEPRERLIRITPSTKRKHPGARSTP